MSYALTHQSMGNIFKHHSENIQFVSSGFIVGLGLLILIQTIYGLR